MDNKKLPAIGSIVYQTNGYGDYFECHVLKHNADGSIDIFEAGHPERKFQTITVWHSKAEFTYP